MRRFNKKGLAVVGVVGVLLTIAIGLVVGIVVLNSFLGGISQAGWSTAANTTISTLTTNIWTAFNLASILPLIIIAAVMIGAVRMFGGGEGE